MIYASDVADIYRNMHSDTEASPQACAILVAGMLIADEIGKLASYLTDEKALGALDLHTKQIAEAIESAGTAISESLEENE